MSKRPKQSDIDADRAALRAIEELVDYQPANQSLSVAMLQQLEATMVASENARAQAYENLLRAQRAYNQACAVGIDTIGNFRTQMRSAKTAVLAQYGPDSYAVDAIGWTRSSDRKRPARKLDAA